MIKMTKPSPPLIKTDAMALSMTVPKYAKNALKSQLPKYEDDPFGTREMAVRCLLEYTFMKPGGEEEKAREEPYSLALNRGQRSTRKAKKTPVEETTRKRKRTISDESGHWDDINNDAGK